jgi:uncharacterized protein YxjI
MSRMYLIRQRIFDLGDDFDITDESGRPVYHVDGKVLSVRDKYTIDIPGPHDLEMRGGLLDHEYTVERDGREVATVSKRWFSIRDTYAVNVVEGEDHLLILAGVLALDLAQSRAEKESDERERDDD